MAQAAARGALVATAAVLPLLLLLAGVALGREEPPALVGAPRDVAAADEGVQRALRFAMAQYNRASNDKYASRVVRVVSAKSQIVAGIKYMIEAEVGRTKCLKSVSDVQSCDFHEAPELAEHVTCSFVVYSVPWLNQTRLLKNTCQ